MDEWKGECQRWVPTVGGELSGEWVCWGDGRLLSCAFLVILNLLGLTSQGNRTKSLFFLTIAGIRLVNRHYLIQHSVLVKLASNELCFPLCNVDQD